MKLSIITINYNNASGLKSTMDSVIPHRSAGIEYIIIDGGSTDNSVDLIRDCKDKIDYWVSEPDRGVFHAMNKGLNVAGGEYLLFINSGDLLRENTDMDKILSYLKNEDMIYFNIEIACAGNQNHFINTYPDALDFKFFAEQSLPHQASFIKRKTLLEYGGYDEDMKLGADWAFSIDAVCLKQYTYKYIDDYFSVYNLDGMSSQYENQSLLREEKRRHIEKNYPHYYSLYKEWIEKKDELYKLKTSVSVRLMKKLGFLKWLK